MGLHEKGAAGTGAPLHIIVANPDSASVAVPVSDAGEAARIAPFSGDVISRLGGVLSSFIVTVVVAVLPAEFTAVPDT
jgi:hypothetical protein